MSARIGAFVAGLLLVLTAPAQADPEKIASGLAAPVGMAFDRDGSLFVAEWSAGRITKIAPGGERTVFASELPSPSGLAIAADGAIYVASYSRDEIYRFAPDGTRETYLTGLATPAGLGFDRSGRLLVANRRTNEILAFGADKIRHAVVSNLRTPVGAVQIADGGYVVANIAGGVTILRGDGHRIETGDGLRAPGAGMAITSAGRIFVVDYGGTTIAEVFADGRMATFADGLPSPVGLALAPDGTALYAATWGDGGLYRIPLAP